MLPRVNRLVERRDFSRVYARGRQVRSPLLTLCFLKQNRAEPRFGFSVSKKVGGAVQRNLLKRRLSEACRRVLIGNPLAMDFVIVARPAALNVSYEELASVVEQMFNRVEQKEPSCKASRPRSPEGTQGQKKFGNISS